MALQLSSGAHLKWHGTNNGWVKSVYISFQQVQLKLSQPLLGLPAFLADQASDHLHMGLE